MKAFVKKRSTACSGKTDQEPEDASRKNPVRLANVDALEKGQAGAAKATAALRNLI